MSEFLEQAQGLQTQQSDVQERARQITTFLERFILSENEIAALRSDPVDSIDEQGKWSKGCGYILDYYFCCALQ